MIKSKFLQAFFNIITFFIISIYSFEAIAKVNAEDLEGYEVDFSSPNREKEEEIVYQYHLNDPFEDTEFLKKEYIGVDLYDIDDDGKKEIIYKITGTSEAGYCGNRGCTFNILKQSDKKDKQGNPLYVPIRWNDLQEKQIRDLVLDKIKILKTTTNGVHDLLLNKNSVWKWQGTHYDRYKSLDELDD